VTASGSTVWDAIFGLGVWALCLHAVYGFRNRWRWTRRVIDWMAWSSQDEKAVLALLLLVDLVVLLLLLWALVS